MKCNIYNSNIRYNILNTGIKMSMENTEIKSSVNNYTYGTSLFLSGTSLFFMRGFEFNQILNIDTLKCRNFWEWLLYSIDESLFRLRSKANF